MSAVTLRSLFEFSGENIERGVAASAENFADGRGEPTLLGFVAEAGARRLNDALEVDVFELMSEAWLTFKQVRDCADPVTHPPGQETIVTLHDVEVTSTNSPLLHTTVAGVSLPDLRFTLDLTAKFKTVQLMVRDARIRSLRPGTGSALVKLSYGKSKLTEHATPEWKLPLEIELGKDGIRIPHRAR